VSRRYALAEATTRKQMLAGVDPRFAAMVKHQADRIDAIETSDGVLFDAALIGLTAGAATPAVLGRRAVVETGGEVIAQTTTRTFANEMADSAQQALTKVGAGKGPVYGTEVHTEFAAINKGKGYVSEQSYLNGRPVDYGTKGSIRIDAASGTIEKPVCVCDLKTGGATLTQQRLQQLQQHLPSGTSIFGVR
jgi:hypothetical protein